ncbi:hypothetical protein BC830DRAFT_1132195 [Chytriomyces sp. MP71]|nr:hypothetical protein BC830DRAFT_1132195 [Chytriomyces sp. MP71]
MLATYTIERLEQSIGREQAPKLLMKTIIGAVCELLPCTQRVQQQTETFAHACAKVAGVSIPMLLVTLTYLERYFQSSVCIRFSEEDTLVRSRVIFIALLTAYKYVAERGVLNKAWMRACKGLFNLVEINQMERLFLAVLQYRLMVEDDQTQASWHDWIDQLVSQADSNQNCESLNPARAGSPSKFVACIASSLNNMPSPHASVEHAVSSSKRRLSLPQVITKLTGWKAFWFF